MTPDGLRSRWLAPVYALVISFLSVLLLGAVVSEPATTPPAGEEPTVDLQFVTTKDEQGGTTPVPVTGPDIAEVTVLVGRGSGFEVGADGKVEDVMSGESLTVCAELPREWSAPGTTKRGEFTCWAERVPKVVGGDRRIELLVNRPTS
ncbi:hypothetical protein [Saccharothrix deserti]|uniref:hypothetical protein n=1 Tax=Saccharothrix deserti TaxID=2593674 RepID=UPI00131D00FC|nr:hypothetical protein [Saccharothrix deserti]